MLDGHVSYVSYNPLRYIGWNDVACSALNRFLQPLDFGRHFRSTITAKAVKGYTQEPIWAPTATFPLPFVKGSHFVERLAPWPTADPLHKESPGHSKNAEFYVPINPCPVLSQLAQPTVVNRAQAEPSSH